MAGIGSYKSVRTVRQRGRAPVPENGAPARPSRCVADVSPPLRWTVELHGSITQADRR